MLAPYDARDIANFLLDIADQQGVGLTQVSLQKTVFYSHGWHLVLKGGPLISNEFEGWRYGPVVRVLRDSFREFGRREITGRARFYDPISDDSYFREYQIGDADKQFLQQMLSFYSKFDPFTLVEMTHREGSPWDQVIASSDANLGRIIGDDLIRRHFEKLLIRRGKI